MLSTSFTKFKPVMEIYVSLMVFLFSAISLIIPSGYSYGPLFLVLGSCVLLNRKKLQLVRQDWIFIGVVFIYVVINFVLNLIHHLPISSFDKLFRYLLAIPVYLLLIAYKPGKQYFWIGLMFGAVGAVAIAICQQFGWFLQLIWPGRSNGFLNPIQFGNISLLIAMLLLPFIVDFYYKNKNVKVLIALIFSSLMGLTASVLSLSRGGWLAAPVILLIFLNYLTLKTRKALSYSFFFIFSSAVIAIFVLPDSNAFKNRLIYTQTEFSKFFQGGNDSAYTSVSSRVQMWENGIDAFKAHPFFGWGDLATIKNNFPAQWLQLNKIEDFNHLHNEYIDVLAKSGLFGFFALMLIYLLPLYYFTNLARSKQKDVLAFAAAGIILIVSIMIFGLTQCFLAHNSGTTVFIFYLVIIKAYCRNILEADDFTAIKQA